MDIESLTNGIKQQLLYAEGTIGKAARINRMIEDESEAQGLLQLTGQLDKKDREYRQEQFVFPAGSSAKWVLCTIVCSVFAAIFSAVLIITISVALYSKDLKMFGIVASVIAGMLVATDVAILILSIKEIRFTKRYRNYYKDLIYIPFCHTRDLTREEKAKGDIINKDLLRAVKHRLIPKGKLDSESDLFFVSSEDYYLYLNKPNSFNNIFGALVHTEDELSMRSENDHHMRKTSYNYLSALCDQLESFNIRSLKEEIQWIRSYAHYIISFADRYPAYAEKLWFLLGIYFSSAGIICKRYKQDSNKKKQQKEWFENSLDFLDSIFSSFLISVFRESPVLIYTQQQEQARAIPAIKAAKDPTPNRSQGAKTTQKKERWCS